MSPPNKAMLKVLKEAAETGPVDLFVPLTHQGMDEDRATAKKLAKQIGARGKMPVILGGHEHEVFHERVGGTETTIFKVGQDALNCGVVDIFWDSEGRVQSDAHLLPMWSPNPKFNPKAQPQTDPEFLPRVRSRRGCPVEAFVARKRQQLEELERTAILMLRGPAVHEPRERPSDLMRVLLGKAKAAYNRRGGPAVDLVMNVGGNSRGPPRHEQGEFTFGNLMAILPFDTSMATVTMKGQWIVDSVRHSRSQEWVDPRRKCPDYLQLDAGCSFADGDVATLTHIGGQRVEPKKDYTVAIYVYVLMGARDDKMMKIPIQPLTRLVKEGSIPVPDEDLCLPLKTLVMECCLGDAWGKIVGASTLEAAFKAIDTNGDGQLTKEELAAAIKTLLDDDDDENDVAPGTRASTSFWTIYHTFLGALPIGC